MDRITTQGAMPAARLTPDPANAGTSIPGDARSLSRSAYTSGALRAWVEVIWFTSRTHQFEPHGAIGSTAWHPSPRAERPSGAILCGRTERLLVVPSNIRAA